MMKNNKAVTALQVIVLIAIIFVAVVGIAFALGSSPTAAANSDITVYIDSVKQEVDVTQPQPYDWGPMTTGYTYTRNFTVVNTGTQTCKITLLTTEPPGTSSTWQYNNTQLQPNTYASAALTYIFTPETGGTYTWKISASNNTVPETSPTPTPVVTPKPNGCQFTINGDNGVTSITVTRNSAAPFVILAEDLPKTYLFTSGDDLKFTCALGTGYEFNGWEYDDGSLPITSITLNMPNVTGNFTVTATAQFMQTD
jgi:uncharacterized repeat protein (TIGR02543 family)